MSAGQRAARAGWTAGADITDWQLTVQARARRVEVDLHNASSEPYCARFAQAAHAELAIVAEALVGPRGFVDRLASWWSGWHIERAWRALHEAEAYATAADSGLARRLPTIAARLAHSLPEDDPRAQAVLRLAGRDELDGPERALVADALRASFDISDEQHAGARALRNKLVGASVALVVLNVCLTVFGLLYPRMLPMCAAASADPMAHQLICVNGASEPMSPDVWLVQLLGGLGALLATVVMLTRRRPSLSPYVLTGYQALIKLTFGSALAVVGVFALGAGVGSGITCLRGQASVLASAVLLGYGQQLGTRLLDNYAEKVMNKVRPIPGDRGGSE